MSPKKHIIPKDIVIPKESFRTFFVDIVGFLNTMEIHFNLSNESLKNDFKPKFDSIMNEFAKSAKNIEFDDISAENLWIKTSPTSSQNVDLDHTEMVSGLFFSKDK